MTAPSHVQTIHGGTRIAPSRNSPIRGRDIERDEREMYALEHPVASRLTSEQIDSIASKAYDNIVDDKSLMTGQAIAKACEQQGVGRLTESEKHAVVVSMRSILAEKQQQMAKLDGVKQEMHDHPQLSEKQARTIVEQHETGNDIWVLEEYRNGEWVQVGGAMDTSTFKGRTAFKVAKGTLERSGEHTRVENRLRKVSEHQSVPDYAVRQLNLTTIGSEERFGRLQDDWARNFYRKKKRGVFNEDLAVKGLANSYVPEMIQFYKKEYGDSGERKNFIGDYDLNRVSKEDKVQIAKEDVLPDVMEKIRYIESRPVDEQKAWLKHEHIFVTPSGKRFSAYSYSEAQEKAKALGEPKADWA
jgi:hypothetical protein